MLEVDPLTRRIRREQQARLAVIELVFNANVVLLVDVAVDDENFVGPRFILREVKDGIKRITVLRE